MPEPTSRIEPANSYREPDPPPSRERARQKPRPKFSEPAPFDAAELVAAMDDDDGDDEATRHQLDTVA